MGLHVRKPVFGVCYQVVLTEPAQLQRLARLLKFACSNFRYHSYQKMSDKDTDQPAWKHIPVVDPEGVQVVRLNPPL